MDKKRTFGDGSPECTFDFVRIRGYYARCDICAISPWTSDGSECGKRARRASRRVNRSDTRVRWTAVTCEVRRRGREEKKTKRSSSPATAARLASRRTRSAPRTVLRRRRRTRGEEEKEEKKVEERRGRIGSSRMSVEPPREFGSAPIDIIGTYRQRLHTGVPRHSGVSREMGRGTKGTESKGSRRSTDRKRY